MANGYHGQVNPEHKRCSQDLYYCWTVRKLCVQLPHSDQSRCVYSAAAAVAAAATASLTILKGLFIKVEQCVSSSVLCDYLRRSIYNRSIVDVFLQWYYHVDTIVNITDVCWTLWINTFVEVMRKPLGNFVLTTLLLSPVCTSRHLFGYHRDVIPLHTSVYCCDKYIEDGRNGWEWTLDWKYVLKTRLSLLNCIFKMNFVHICFL